jgi:ATP-binding cassette subfamily F protein 3
MSIISFSKVSYSLGARNLFHDLSFAIEPGERTAVVGLNGAGKSTLLKLIAGLVEPDSGTIARKRGAIIEYVPQVLPEELHSLTLFEALTQKLTPAMQFSGFEYLIEGQLCAAGFPHERHQQQLRTLSGGELNRLLVARALVNEPDLILLDEPTNHMDIEQVALFERFVREELSTALVVVSHDREFLDAATTKTLFLRDAQIEGFNLAFSEARCALAQADEAARKRRLDEERELNRLQEAADQLAEWGRIYSNEKFSYRAKSMQKRVEKLQHNMTELPSVKRASVRLDTQTANSHFLLDIQQLPLATPDGRSLCEIEKLAVGRGERVAVIGKNGCGKSTLVKAIVRRWATGSSTAQIRFNPATSIGYYDQQLAHFVPGERLANAVMTRCQLPQQRIVQELVTAGFPYERHKERVDILSGGERARLTFLLLKLSQPHLLILDEPTNHLDVVGIEQLEESLIESGSTIVFVSHDRRFVERVATRVYEMG